MHCNKLECCNNSNGICKALKDCEPYLKRCAFYKTREELANQKRRIKEAKIKANDYIAIKLEVLGGKDND